MADRVIVSIPAASARVIASRSEVKASTATESTKVVTVMVALGLTVDDAATVPGITAAAAIAAAMIRRRMAGRAAGDMATR